MEKKLFKGFLVGRNNVEIGILQYVDDTIFFREASMENVKAIKVILRSFCCSILSVSIYHGRRSYIRVKSYDRWNFREPSI